MYCDKQKYTHAQAKKVRGSAVTNGQRMRLYFCACCKAWHNTKEAYNDMDLSPKDRKPMKRNPKSRRTIRF